MSDVTLPHMEGPVCPAPLPHAETIVMGHGSGGRMMHDLIRKTFLPHLDNPILRAGNDAARLPADTHAGLAISTDCHVVSPLFFPGGDIGRLAVCGTVNDVAMLGAEPRYLTAGFILEEGLSIQTLERVLESMRQAADEAGVQIVAGDTKVVQKGLADGMYITTAGVGVRRGDLTLGGERARPGDVVILSGTIGDHGIAVLSARGELGFAADIRSDVAPLNHMIAALLEATTGVHALRDPTRGGVATTLNEIARQSGVCIEIEEDRLPVAPPVAAACEMLGFDPLYIANEGKLIAIVEADAAATALEALRASRYGAQAVVIGKVTETPAGRVLMKTAIGGRRVVDMPAGEVLPRIC